MHALDEDEFWYLRNLPVGSCNILVLLYTTASSSWPSVVEPLDSVTAPPSGAFMIGFGSSSLSRLNPGRGVPSTVLGVSGSPLNSPLIELEAHGDCATAGEGI